MNVKPDNRYARATLDQIAAPIPDPVAADTVSCRALSRVAALILFSCMAGGVIRAQAAVPTEHGLISRYEGSKTCAKCHPGVREEVATSLHYQHRARSLNVAGHENDEMGMVSEYCGLPAAVTAINWIGLLQPQDANLAAQPGGCARCHAGLGAKPNPIGNLTDADYDNIDCLVCHAANYARTVTGVNGSLSLAPAPGVDVVAAAQSAQKPTSDMCLRCHAASGGGPNFKHGDVPSTATDVHLSAGLQCVECHVTSSHRIAGAGDLKAVDEANVRVSCDNCHTSAPHKGVNVIYNTHAQRVACETCHIPLIARAPSKPTVLQRDWSQPVFNPATGLFDPKNVLANDIKPVYRWWNRKVQKYPPAPLGSITDGNSKIYPWKHITSYVPADAQSHQLIPLKAGFYSTSGSVDKAVSAGASQSSTPYSGSWISVPDELHFAVSHQVAPKEQALRCGDCHVPEAGRLDFAALGYSKERVAVLQRDSLWKGPDHTGRFGSSYNGSTSCTACHGNKVDEVMNTIHYTWRTPNSKLAYPGGGSHGMIDRFCALVGSSAMVNYYGDLGGHKGSSACGKCHIGDGLPFPDPATGQFNSAQKESIDCLICHASEGQYDMNGDGLYGEQDAEATHRVLRTDPKTGHRYWFQDRSLRAAESVGKATSVAACQRCHEHGMSAPDYKRGTPYTPEHDVHAAAGMLCTECHKVDHHKMARGSRVADMHGWELQDVEVDCANCHTSRPHKESSSDYAKAPYNDHTAVMACETCHIPVTSGATRRVWASTFGVTDGPEASIPKPDATTGVYEPFSDYDQPYAMRPAYRWFNGNSSMLAEPIHDANAWDFQVATKNTPSAKIYPFRPIVSGMIMDANGLGSMPGFSSQFTMLGAMEAMQGPMKMLEFMRLDGLNERERMVLSQFPNLLVFDKEHYLRTGNVRAAVNIGMARLGMIMSGGDAFGTPSDKLNEMGANMWSGELLGLDLPNNPADPTYQPGTDPTRVTGSFISLSHAVKRSEALRCADCHNASSVLDFKALGYSPGRAQQLMSLFDRVQFISSWKTEDGLLLRWSGLTGRTYQLMMTTDLNSGQWKAISDPITSPDTWCQLKVPSASLAVATPVFFRVVELRP